MSVDAIEKAEWETEMQALCEQHRWTLLDEEIDAPNSPFIRRIIDHKGRPHILKVRAAQLYKENETEAMLAFRASRRVPKVRVLSEDSLVFLVKDLGGLTLHLAMRADEEFLWRSAKLVRRLHRLPVPDWALPVPRRLALRHHVVNWPDEMNRRAHEALDELLAGPSEDYFLHGDFHPRNVIVSKGKLWAIDPFGLRGDRAYDVALMAAHTSDPIRAASKLEARYGEELPRLNLWLAWCCYMAISNLRIRGEDTTAAQEALRRLTPGR